MSLTLAITTYKRYEMLIESYSQVLDDPRITEVIILDDCTPAKEIREKILNLDKTHKKIKTYTQVFNRGMSVNKRDAIGLATNDWVIIFDSDNVITSKYIDAIPKVLDSDIIYCPEFAEPKFDYTKWAGYLMFGKQVAKNIHDDQLNMLMNTCNYLVNRDMYLQVYCEPHTDVKGADTIAFNYDWLSYGCGFFICPGMRYFHRVHDKSGFMENVDHNMRIASEYRNKISQL